MDENNNRNDPENADHNPKEHQQEQDHDKHDQNAGESENTSQQGRHPSERVLGIDQSQKSPFGSGVLRSNLYGDSDKNQETTAENQDSTQKTEQESSEESQKTGSAMDTDAVKRIEQLEQELNDTKDKYVRAVAEAENVRKRTSRERQDISKYAISSFAKDLLDFADNFRRGIESLPEDLKESDERIKNTFEGIEAMERELLKMFERHGIRKMEPMNEKFDPNFHEVMFETPTEGKEEGTIVHLVEPGYMLHDRLLRPARVGVAKDDGTQTDSPPQGGQNLDEEI